MDYSLEEIKVTDLVELLDKGKIDLNPPYQRNFIWSPNDQKELVDSIIRGFPLPNFFLFEKNDGKYEMVDGQQRTTTIYNFAKGKITSSNKSGKIKINEVSEDFFNYRLPVIIIKNIENPELLNEFYALINKKGKHLNVAELNKSEHSNSKFLKLANEALTFQNFIDLDIFTDASSKRMNDRAFVEELFGYLQFGIKEKKDTVNLSYKNDINSEEYLSLKNTFLKVIQTIHTFNSIKKIKNTRYKQKNDFYTLFTFINDNKDIDINTLNYQFKILLIIDKKDKEGRQFIRPTNEDCEPFREYANNCVSQSNSKYARLKRLQFFESMLKNQDIQKNEVLQEVMRYLSDIYGESKIDLKRVNNFQLLDIELLNYE